MQPKTPKARRTRERLIHEAAQLFSVKGYFHTTVDDVLARASLTKGGFYAHFESKEDLARAVIDHALLVWIRKVADHVAQHSDPRQQLRAVFEGYRLYAVDRTFEGGCFFVNLATELDDQNEELRKLLDECFAQFRGMVGVILDSGKERGLYRADMPTEAVALAVVSYLTGTMMQAKAGRDFSLFDRGNAVIVDLVSTYET